MSRYTHKALLRPLSSLNFQVDELPQRPMMETVFNQARRCGVNINPRIYIGPEWFCPDGSLAISLPYYLFDKNLGKIHRKHHPDRYTEGYDPIRFKKLLRHELGHAFDHAYRIHKRRDFRKIFGNPNGEFTTERASRKFVSNLPGCYGSTHPTEDFAETFAMCITPGALKRNFKNLSLEAKSKVLFVLKMIKDHEKAAIKSTDRRPQSDFSSLKSDLITYLNVYA